MAQMAQYRPPGPKSNSSTPRAVGKYVAPSPGNNRQAMCASSSARSNLANVRPLAQQLLSTNNGGFNELRQTNNFDRMLDFTNNESSTDEDYGVLQDDETDDDNGRPSGRATGRGRRTRKISMANYQKITVKKNSRDSNAMKTFELQANLLEYKEALYEISEDELMMKYQDASACVPDILKEKTVSENARESAFQTIQKMMTRKEQGERADRYGDDPHPVRHRAQTDQQINLD